MGKGERLLMANLLEATFPRLTQENYSVTSLPSNRYNCIAWAAGHNANWWWPGPDVELEYWPENATRAETLDAFQEAFASLGYAMCQDSKRSLCSRTIKTARRTVRGSYPMVAGRASWGSLKISSMPCTIWRGAITAKLWYL